MYKNLIAAWRGIFLVLSLHLAQHAVAQEPLKAAFVYVAPLTETGWVRQHESGRLAVEAQLNVNARRVQTTYVENVAEGPDAERVIRDLARQGHQIIFTPSFGYMEPTMRVAAEFPHVKFESVTGYKRTTNVATANARYYEGRYLAGIAAGRASNTGVLGYVAGFPIPEVLQGLNAFTLGARSVRPDAQVRVIWLQTWFDPARERDAAMTLMNQGVDVLAFHTGSNAVMVAAQERGKLAIAYHSDMRKVAPDAQLLAVTHHWGDYYTRRVQAVLQGRWESGDTWGGVREGMVRIEGFGPKLSAIVRQELQMRQAELAQGRLQIFKGPLLDDRGQTVVPAGQTLSDSEILGMSFRVQGVRSM
ncbi:MAG: BMP family ABC transporter substrate-binding protein [Alphaproteobacteria bacterium]|nr:BMP family ABC transporter substrate-binding protein [Alphaproteobacteria bacterium]